MQYLKDKVEEYGRIQDMVLVRLSAMEGVIQDLQNVGADKKQQSDQATNTEHYTPISAHKSLEHPQLILTTLYHLCLSTPRSILLKVLPVVSTSQGPHHPRLHLHFHLFHAMVATLATAHRRHSGMGTNLPHHTLDSTPCIIHPLGLITPIHLYLPTIGTLRHVWKSQHPQLPGVSQ